MPELRKYNTTWTETLQWRSEPSHHNQYVMAVTRQAISKLIVPIGPGRQRVIGPQIVRRNPIIRTTPHETGILPTTSAKSVNLGRIPTTIEVIPLNMGQDRKIGSTQASHALHLETGTPVTTVEDVAITLGNVLQVNLKDVTEHQVRDQAGVIPVVDLDT